LSRTLTAIEIDVLLARRKGIISQELWSYLTASLSNIDADHKEYQARPL
jgi:hypothetical protein